MQFLVEHVTFGIFQISYSPGLSECFETQMYNCTIFISYNVLLIENDVSSMMH